MIRLRRVPAFRVLSGLVIPDRFHTLVITPPSTFVIPNRSFSLVIPNRLGGEESAVLGGWPDSSFPPTLRHYVG
jgi:hypothetical protein